MIRPMIIGIVKDDYGVMYSLFVGGEKIKSKLKLNKNVLLNKRFQKAMDDAYYDSLCNGEIDADLDLMWV